MTPEQRHWVTRAEVWVRAALRTHGRQLIGPLEPIRWWSLSRVLRVPTDAGALYFKASARLPLVANEALLLPYLATHVGASVPPVLASEPDARWLLLADVGPSLDGPLPLEQKLAIVHTIATIQRATIGHVDALRRPDRLAARLDTIVTRALAMVDGSPHQHAALRRRVQELAQLCAAVAASAIPATLIHGDLHPGNMTVRGGVLTIVDWAEACISHPFLDMFTIFNEEDVARRVALRDAYLAPWDDLEPVGRLHQLWAMAGVVHALHHLESYVSILEHTDAQDELGDAIPFLLDKAERYLVEADLSQAP